MAYDHDQCTLLNEEIKELQADIDKKQRYVDAYSDIELEHLQTAQEAQKKINEAQAIIDAVIDEQQVIIDEQQIIHEKAMTFADHMGKRVDAYKAERDALTDKHQEKVQEFNEHCSTS